MQDSVENCAGESNVAMGVQETSQCSRTWLDLDEVCIYVHI